MLAALGRSFFFGVLLPYYGACPPTLLQLMGKIRGGFNNLERQIDRLDKEHREGEAAPAKLNLCVRGVVTDRLRLTDT